tara:strand:+ start:449 stop:790 length:342 start_codon:yes stop_codon:yes gene_type:complete
MPKGALSNILSGDLYGYEGTHQPIQQHGPYGANVQDMYSRIQLEKGWGSMKKKPYFPMGAKVANAPLGMACDFCRIAMLDGEIGCAEEALFKATWVSLGGTHHFYLVCAGCFI